MSKDMTDADAAALQQTAAAGKVRAIRESSIKTGEARDAYAAATGAEQGKWANLMKMAAIVGMVPEDWRGDDKTRKAIDKKLVNGLIDHLFPKYASTDLSAYYRVMNGTATDADKKKYGNLNPVTAKSLYGVAHQRRAEIRGLITCFGSENVQAEAMRGLDRHPSFRKSGGAQVYFGRLLSAARDYMKDAKEPTTQGLCAVVDRTVESMIEKADAPKPKPNDLEKVTALRKAIVEAVGKLVAIEESAHLRKDVAAAVQKMITDNTMLPITPAEDAPRVKRAERHAKVKPAGKPAEGKPLPLHENDAVLAVADQGLAAVLDAARQYPDGPPADKAAEMRAKAASMDKPRKGPRVNAKATLDADELASL
jgi:hypothetical protein